MNQSKFFPARLSLIFVPLGGTQGEFRVSTNTAYDWGYERYDDTATFKLAGAPLLKNLPDMTQKMESGALVKIFKNVTKGEIAWHGTLDLEYNQQNPIGMQKGVDAPKWQAMFYDEMPARLMKDGQPVFGRVGIHSEQGPGTFFAFYEYGKDKPEHMLVTGDDLIIYSKVMDGDVEWQGRVAFTADRGEDGIQDVRYRTWSTEKIMRGTGHMYPEKWMEYSFDRRPVSITPEKN